MRHSSLPSCLAASITGGTALLFLAILFFFINHESAALARSVTWLFLAPFALISFALTGLACVSLGLPLYNLACRYGWARFPVVLIGAAAMGCVLVPAVWHFLIGPTMMEGYLRFSGAAAGLAAGAAFWIAGPPGQGTGMGEKGRTGNPDIREKIGGVQ